ncbi:hypothetical protein MKP05_09380 [Halomonas sp. EGI 63088]|uniref:Uncharacterized protein n=1 Tax=Halomonas flagellata TaxID=2920385 RepID=A0ABS9RU52_9GAMM|nr:hypothetical protein [Halomonas flagellata]MCH4563340.1 hypothetical protein [Halomonas flagellata]
MRKLLATLMLLTSTSLSAADMTRFDCMTHESREAMITTAMEVMDAKDRGVTERSLIELFLQQEGQPFRASLLAAVDEIYSSSIPISSVADAMQLACHQAASE